MAKYGSVSYYASQLRKTAQRRIARLEKAINATGGTQRTRNWAIKQIAEITTAIQNSYSRVAGERRSAQQIGKGLQQLAKATAKIEPTYTLAGDPFEVTQRELNKASVDAPSAYTHTEAKVFYRATQKIWQQKGVGEHDRNVAILEHYNKERIENGLDEMTLDEIVEFVLKATKQAQEEQKINPRKPMTDDETEAFNRAQRQDNQDAEAGSPPGIGQFIISQVLDALDQLGTLANPLDYTKD